MAILATFRITGGEAGELLSVRLVSPLGACSPPCEGPGCLPIIDKSKSKSKSIKARNISSIQCSCALTRADGMESETAFYMYYSLEV